MQHGGADLQQLREMIGVERRYPFLIQDRDSISAT